MYISEYVLMMKFSQNKLIMQIILWQLYYLLVNCFHLWVCIWLCVYVCVWWYQSIDTFWGLPIVNLPFYKEAFRSYYMIVPYNPLFLLQNEDIIWCTTVISKNCFQSMSSSEMEKSSHRPRHHWFSVLNKFLFLMYFLLFCIITPFKMKQYQRRPREIVKLLDFQILFFNSGFHYKA